MTRGEKLHEGKAKVVYATDDPDVYIQDFKDEATAFDGKKKGSIGDKGRINNQISARLFSLLEEAGVKTHFLALESATAMRIRRLNMFKVEFVARNVAAGSLSKRIGLPEGTRVNNPPVVEYYYKDDQLGDPLLCQAHLDELGVITQQDLEEATRAARRVNDVLMHFFADRGLMLVDFKLEFGRDAEGRLRLGDEISPDTCRLWDAETQEKLDKDRFRRDLGGVEDAYSEVLRRVSAPGSVAPSATHPDGGGRFEVAVYIAPKQGIFDIQGAAIERALVAVGFGGMQDVRVGRFITFDAEGVSESAVRDDLDSMCRQLLANPMFEDYRFELREVVRQP